MIAKLKVPFTLQEDCSILLTYLLTSLLYLCLHSCLLTCFLVKKGKDRSKSLKLINPLAQATYSSITYEIFLLLSLDKPVAAFASYLGNDHNETKRRTSYSTDTVRIDA